MRHETDTNHRKTLSFTEDTCVLYHYSEIIARDDRVSIFHPSDGGRRWTCDITLKDNVHRLLSVRVRGSREKARRNCKINEWTDVQKYSWHSQWLHMIIRADERTSGLLLLCVMLNWLSSSWMLISLIWDWRISSCVTNRAYMCLWCIHFFVWLTEVWIKHMTVRCSSSDCESVYILSKSVKAFI